MFEANHPIRYAPYMLYHNSSIHFPHDTQQTNTSLLLTLTFVATFKNFSSLFIIFVMFGLYFPRERAANSFIQLDLCNAKGKRPYKRYLKDKETNRGYNIQISHTNFSCVNETHAHASKLAHTTYT